jgi:enamine deaminase RidA (YjgF/YER057c/UK114 family)
MGPACAVGGMVPIFFRPVHKGEAAANANLWTPPATPNLREKRSKSMFRFLTPKFIRAPFARYSHAVEVPPGKRLVLCSGQVAVGPDEAIPEDVGAQTELCFSNIAAVLGEAGLGLEHIVRINAYITDRAYLQDYMAVRDRLVSDPPPASTLMIVSGFSRPEFKVEVEVIAAGD